MEEDQAPLAFAEELSQSYGGSIISCRYQATLIDFGVLCVLMMASIGVTRTSPDNMKVTACILVVSAYYLLLEGLAGVTVGKLVTGIRVVDRDGTRPVFLQGVVRTTLRMLEVNPFLLGGLPAFVAVAKSKSKQRLGDMLAGTYVVYRKDLIG